MVMVGHSQRLREPLRWTKVGKAAVAATAGLVAAAAIALVVVLAVGSSSAKPGCISVAIRSTLGGATVQACGARAKRDCAAPHASSFHGELRSLRSACEAAKLPYGTASG